MKEKAIPCLTNLSQSHDKLLRGLANEALSLLGHCKPLTSPGIRVLSIDGGGTRFVSDNILLLYIYLYNCVSAVQKQFAKLGHILNSLKKIKMAYICMPLSLPIS